MKKDPHQEIKRRIIAQCLQLEKIGYFVGTWGNVSVRVPEGFIMTPSRIAYDVMVVEDFVTLALDRTVLHGHRLPSSETDVHRAVYNQRKDVGAIIHSHSPYASAVSCLRRSIPPFVEDLAQVAGATINCTQYARGGEHEKLARQVAKSIGQSNAVLLANHGAVTCGRDLAEAFVTAQIVEKAALMLLLTTGAGKLHSIPAKYVRAERNRYLYSYGTAKDFK